MENKWRAGLGAMAVGGLLALPLYPEPLAARQPAPVLVELFTSQGCNSCPPADAVLGELAGRPDVLALAFHVTYWDRLGWKDTLGDERFTARQRDYARLLGRRQLYTPQAVVAGQLDLVGSSGGQLAKAVDTVAEHGEAKRVEIAADGTVVLPPSSDDEPAVVWAAAWDDLREVVIERGENGGRTIAYHNAVRWLEPLGSPGDARLAVPLDELRRAGRSGVAVVVQRASDGKVLALGQLRLTPPAAVPPA